MNMPSQPQTEPESTLKFDNLFKTIRLPSFLFFSMVAWPFSSALRVCIFMFVQSVDRSAYRQISMSKDCCLAVHLHTPLTHIMHTPSDASQEPGKVPQDRKCSNAEIHHSPPTFLHPTPSALRSNTPLKTCQLHAVAAEPP